MNSKIVDEIVSLGRMRVQKIFGLFGHVVVMEIFTKQHRRLYFIFDSSKTTKTLHMQKEKLVGAKSKSPFVSLLTKYCLDKPMSIYKLDNDGTVIKFMFADDISMIIETDSTWSAGLFQGNQLISAQPSDDPPPFRAGFLVSTEKDTSLVENFRRANFYQDFLRKTHQEEIFATLMASYKKDLAKRKTLLKNVEGDRERCAALLASEHDANLLVTNMHLLKRGMKEASIMDYTIDPPAMKIVLLDEKLQPQDYVKRIFTRIKKAKRGMSIIEERLKQIRSGIDSLTEEIEQARLEGSANLSVVDDKHRREKIYPKKDERKPYRVFLSKDGITIWVGKSARDSDDMLRLTKGNEWFFHARDVAAAHVVVKTSGDLPTQTMIEAALLAHHFSKNRTSDSSIIQYTRLKHVQKKKGLAPGKVIITQEKTIDIEMDEQMLKELIERS